MQAGKRAFWVALSCGLTLLVGGALADVLEPPASVVKAIEVNSQAANTAPTFMVPQGWLASNLRGDSFANDVAIESNGKIIAVGGAYDGSSNFALARYLPNGSLDTGFGNGGLVTTNFSGIHSANRVFPQTDGKILVSNGSTILALARYMPDGTLDNNYGNGGWVTISLGGIESSSSATIQSDGKAILAGSRVNNSSEFALVRFLSDGAIDTDFGSSGLAITNLGGRQGIVSYITIQPDEKILAVGTTMDGAYDIAVARFLPNGLLDPSFGGVGYVTSNIGGSDSSGGAILQPDGKILVAGSSYTASSEFVLVRYMTNGELDTGFGSGGIVRTSFGDYSSGNSIILQADGKIVVAGGVHLGSNGPWKFALARYMPNGELDTSFGSTGLITTSLGGSGYSTSSILQQDGRIVLAGWRYNNSNLEDFALARYLPDGNLDYTFGTPENTLIYSPLGYEQSKLNSNGKSPGYAGETVDV